MLIMNLGSKLGPHHNRDLALPDNTQTHKYIKIVLALVTLPLTRGGSLCCTWQLAQAG